MTDPIRPSALNPAASVTNGAAIPVDNGTAVEKATPLQIANAAIPLASQAEAEAGLDNAKRMSPLRVKQAIAALAPGSSGGSVAPGVLITDYGGVGNDSTNNVSALDAAEAAALTQGRPIFVPNGIYRFASTATIERVGLIGESVLGTVLKLTGAGKGLQIGVPVGTSSYDTLNKPIGNFSILANSTTTHALNSMRCQFSQIENIQVLHPATVGATYVSFRLGGAEYYNDYANLFSDTTDFTTVSPNGKGFWIGNGENEANQAFAARNVATYRNLRAIRVPVGMDLDNVAGADFIGCGAEICATAGIRLRGHKNTIITPWLESADLVVDTFTPADGSGGFGAAQKPSNNVVIFGSLAPNVHLINSTGILLIGDVGNITKDAGVFNTQHIGRVLGTDTDNSSDGIFFGQIGGINTLLMRNGTTDIIKMEANASQAVITLPGSGGRQIKSHSSGTLQLVGGTQPIEIGAGSTQTNLKVNTTAGTTAPGAGGAGALPATPAGYAVININGTDRKVPYY